MKNSEVLRVALVVGTLGRGGAEKQLIYIARVLKQAGVDLRVYCLTQHEPYEAVLRHEGIEPIWVGSNQNPVIRLLEIVRHLRAFKPHLIQSSHFYTNLYAALAGRIVGGISVGSIRSDVDYELQANGLWGPWLLRLPDVLIANSNTARRRAMAYKVRPGRLFVLPNVIDLTAFDRQASQPFSFRFSPGHIHVVTVARLIEAKRLDRFLNAIVRARDVVPNLVGVIAGEGPMRSTLEKMAFELGLLPEGVIFLGHCENVPALLSRMDIFLLTSDHEGFPNGLLEAMAAGLSVITTPAGDAGQIVRDGISGFVVDKEDETVLVKKLILLAQNPQLRQTMGDLGRRLVIQNYAFQSLQSRLMQT